LREFERVLDWSSGCEVVYSFCVRLFMSSSKYQGKQIHIVGFAGAEGAALFRYFLNEGYAKHLTVHDSSEKERFLKNFRNAHTYMDNEESRSVAEELLMEDGATYYFGDEYLTGIEDADVIFVPQSWYLYDRNQKLFELVDKMGSMMKLYFDLFPGKIVGVTGSNGKTTTSNMIYHVLQSDAVRQGRRIFFAGNDRRNRQILDVIHEATEDDVLVLEISNRHLKIDLGKSPDVAVITNITPNHLLEYDGFDDYRAGKLSLLQHLTKEQESVMNLDDDESRRHVEHSDEEHWCFSRVEEVSRGAYVKFGKIYLKHAEGEEEVMGVDMLQVKGQHNVSNALAAVIACHLVGVPVDHIAKGMREFEGVPQRLELVRVIDIGDGVRVHSQESANPDPAKHRIEFYNDSASTDPVSTIAALRAFYPQVVHEHGEGDHHEHQCGCGRNDSLSVLILGGKSKGVECGQLIEEIKKNCGAVIVIKSPFGDEVKSGLEGWEFEVVEVKSLSAAVERSFEIAKESGMERVIFSPGAEYFVYFKDKMKGYKSFRTFVERLG
jgi:UDP-N-acetylmuramoylalanine--D-glutamate ligase